MGGGLGGKTGLYAVNPQNFKGKSYVEGDIAIGLSLPSGNNATLVKSFIDLSTESSKLTDNARAIQARYNKGYSHHSGEVSGVAVPVLTPDRIEKRQNGRRFKTDGEPMFTLNTQDKHGVYNGLRIRRLTPKECERLMGLTDDWTRYGIKPDGTQYELSDSARYKLCGNGVVVNVVKEIKQALNF